VSDAAFPADLATPAGWAAATIERLGLPALRFESAGGHLHAIVLLVHGRLVEHLERFREPGAPTAPDGALRTEHLAELIAVAEADALARGVRLPLPAIAARFGLSWTERALVELAVARAVAPGTAALIAAAHGSPERGTLTVGLATALLSGDPLFTPPPLALFGSSSRPLRSGLLRLAPPPAGAPDLLIERLVLPSNALVAALGGEATLAEPLLDVAEIRPATATLLDLVSEEPVRRALEAIALSLPAYLERGPKPPGERPAFAPAGVLALLSGPPGCGKSLAAEALAGTAGKDLLRVSCPRVAAAPDPLRLVDAVFAQATLFDAVVCLDRAEALLGPGAPALSAVLEDAERHRGLTIVTTSYPERLAPELEPRLVFQVRLGRPDAQLREELWESHLPAEIGPDVAPGLANLAYQYELTGAQVRNAVTWAWFRAARRSPAEPVVAVDDLARGAREQLAARLEGATERKSARQGLEAIVLPPATEAAVREFLDGCRHRTAVLNEWGFGRRLSTGKGIVALFSGEPGTGKTYCAELLAHELGLVLHVVSIPNIMSKWVGETEQNIARLFSHARAQNTILMFDEADALFTTRVKVENASDRFSNMEVNQLLQEVDRFEGIVILTTNLESGIDRAFKRRVSFHVDFPMPDVAVRAQIWQTLLPPEAPVSGPLDFDALARSYELAGGHIKNILVRAAYRACARGKPIDMDLLHEVAEDECRSAGKLYRRGGAEGPPRRG